MPIDVVEKAMEGFSVLLKKEGLLVLTIDIPSMSIEFIIRTAWKSGFELAGNLDMELPPDAIYSPLLGGLNCFRILLRKKR